MLNLQGYDLATQHLRHHPYALYKPDWAKNEHTANLKEVMPEVFSAPHAFTTISANLIDRRGVKIMPETTPLSNRYRGTAVYYATQFSPSTQVGLYRLPVAALGPGAFRAWGGSMSGGSLPILPTGAAKLLLVARLFGAGNDVLCLAYVYRFLWLAN